MMATGKMLIATILLAGLLSFAVLATTSTDAAPIAPVRRTLPDEIMVLADIKKVQLDIREFAPLLKQAGLNSRRVEDNWREQLSKAGLEVVDDIGPDVVTITLDSRAADDANIPDGVGFATFLKVYRPVRVDGFDEPMRLPVYVDVTGGADNEDDLGETAFSTVKTLLGNFVRGYKLATSEKAARSKP